MVQRVCLPRSALGLFTVRQSGGTAPRAPLAAVAEALGLGSVDGLHAALTGSSWTPSDPCSAAEFVALAQVLQFRTSQASKVVRDIASGGLTRVAHLPTDPVSFPAAASSAATGTEPANEKDEEMADARSVREAPHEPPWEMCDPEDVGMDREPLEKCRQYLRYRIGRKHFAGIVGGVVKNGKLVYFDEAGYADVATKTPMRQDTIVRLFSMTKCIVVVAFLSYAEDPARGVDLDDPVWKYIPSFKKIVMAPKRGSTKPRELETKVFEEKGADGRMRQERLPTGPTLRHLLTHTAGLGYGPTLGDSLPPKHTDHFKIYYDLVERAHKGQIASLAEWVDELAQIPLKVRPGSYWEYSFATDVLGRVVEVISGLPLDKAVEERVCGPLGMVDTGFRVPEDRAARMGAWYEKKAPTDDQGKPKEKVPAGATYSLEVLDKPGSESGWVGENCSKILSGGGTVEVPLSAKGGMVSTFKDYLRFLIMIRNLGELDGVRVLRRETVQTMICNQIPASTGRRAAWVFDKKGQGYNFVGQIQVQHYEKDTFQEKGELKKGNSTLASLAPGTVSAEFGWGGLGGPAWTIDPRADLIVLSMTQTALELDHEENLRFSARRAIHAGIFGVTAGAMKVTDYPTEFHEGPKGGKLYDALERLRIGRTESGKQASSPKVKKEDSSEAELQAFMEAEQEAKARPKTLKELVVARGNIGHEVKEDDEDAEEDARSADGTVLPQTANANARADVHNEVRRSAKRLLRRTSSTASTNSSQGLDVRKRRAVNGGHGSGSPGLRKRQAASITDATGSPGLRKRQAASMTDAAGDKISEFVSPLRVKKGKQAKTADVAQAPDKANEVSPGRVSKLLKPSKVAKKDQSTTISTPERSGPEPCKEDLLFQRVCMRSEADDDIVKARVTAVSEEQIEVVSEGDWCAKNVRIGDVTLIDESNIGNCQGSRGGPTDFGFLMKQARTSES